MSGGAKGSGPDLAPGTTTSEAPAVSTFAPLRQPPLGSLNVDSLSGDELKAYARRAGVLPRDVDNLTEDRLRQNTKLVIANHFDLISDGV